MPYETWTSKHLAELELLPSDLRGCLGLSDAVLSHPTEVAGFFFLCCQRTTTLERPGPPDEHEN